MLAKVIFVLSTLLIAGLPIEPASKVTPDLLARDAAHFLEYSNGPTVEELLKGHSDFDVSRQEYVVGRHLRDESRIAFTPTSDSLAQVKELAYNADAIVVGRTLRRSSALIPGHQFAFSDYDVSVEKVLMDRKHFLEGKNDIVVSRAGGVVHIDQATFRFVETDFPLLRLNTSYVFFLHLTSDSGSFRVNPEHAFLLDGAFVRPMSRHPHPLLGDKEFNRFMDDLKISINSDQRLRQ